ncbi:hypothetical protein ROHU_035082 [Labeo rohita]|uniref:DUF6729 domain-containing protein n=2 Tax=Labeo rohita TaxID=84645 RepID=A0A498L1J0_LABRO|nr:hypothetical protein ROHU_035082 [Labeo rohita]
MAGYLVSLNRTITALSTKEITEILRLYWSLHAVDRSPSKYALKCKKNVLPGPWRASQKRSGSAPGQQAAERLFMTHGQAAQRPDVHRISECIALKLLKEFREARNRPKDNKGKIFPIPQSIVMTYSHIKQLLEDCREVLDKTNLVLVTVNNTTVSSWLLDRQKRTDRDTLLQGVELPQQVGLANEPLPKPKVLPSALVQHSHVPITFQEPENREDERVAVEYLLAQSDRGDLLSPLVHGEITPPETQEVEVQEDECLDVTICDAADINLEAHTLSSSSSHDDSLISSLQTALGVQAGPLSSAGVQAEPLSSAGTRPAPQSSAGSRPAPQSSVGFIPAPHSSAVFSPAPQSSAGSRPAPQSSAVSSPAPQSSAGSRPAPQSSAVSRPAPQSSAGSRPAPQSSVGFSPAPQSSAVSSPAPQSSAVSSLSPQSSSLIKCSLCNEDVDVEGFTEHLSDYHVQETCDQCGATVWGAVGLLHHIEYHHPLTSLSGQDRRSVDPPAASPTTSTAQSPAYTEEQQGASQTTLHSPSLRPPEVNWAAQRLDVHRISECIALKLLKEFREARNRPKDNKGKIFPIPQSIVMTYSHIKQLLEDCREVLDKTNLVLVTVNNTTVSSCNNRDGLPFLLANSHKRHHRLRDGLLFLLANSHKRHHRLRTDNVLEDCTRQLLRIKSVWQEESHQRSVTQKNITITSVKYVATQKANLPAIPRKCVTLLKPRTAGNSSSYLQQALEEIHSEEWARRTVDYLTDCELHKKRCALTQLDVVYDQPPPFCPLPLAQWFETAHANEILNHLDELKGVITSTYGSILKLDSTKKITKKLAGGIADTATWMTNVGNEFGQVLNCVLTTGEGAGLDDLCQGIVKRYKDAGEPEPAVIYVDRDGCSGTGVTPVLTWFRPWKVTVRLDVFHFMRRFTAGLTTEHHPLYGTFCSKLSSCIFEWDKDDISRLKEAKKTMLLKKHGGHILSSITSNELAKHCRRRTRGVEETRALIHGLLDSMWELTDTTGLHLINPESMAHVQEVQQKHLSCIQDPPDVQLYTKLGSGLQKGDKILDVLRCGRGSSSLESFHRHQCTFIPDERVAVEYLLAQSDRGDLLSPLVHGEITPPETQEVEVQEDECLDVTICDAADINLEAHTLSSSSSHDDSLISSLVISLSMP